MKLSTKTRYATRALIDLALHRNGTPVLLRDIAHRQQISLPYLEQIVAPLKAGGLIRSIRGTKGGVLLARDAEEIRLSEVINLFEGTSALVDCVNDASLCDRSEHCVTRDVWKELKAAIDGVLESTTLHNLAVRQKEKKGLEKSMYYI